MSVEVQQPSIASLVDKISAELNAKTVLLLLEGGEILAHAGWIENNMLPNLAALITASASAGRSVGEIAANCRPKHFHYDFESGQLYATAIGRTTWLAAFQEDTSNPGLFRLRMRRFGQGLERLLPKEEEVAPAGVTVTPPKTRNAPLFANITDEEIDSLFQKPRGGNT